MLPNNVKISVIIPCYNHGKFLEEAIQSVLKSNFENYEIIIVNDGSTDHLTLRVFKKIEKNFMYDRRIRIMQQGNQGLADARNNAIKAAIGEYILPLDADNKISAKFLKKAVEILEKNPEVGVVYAYAKFFGDREGIWEFPQFDSKRLLLGNFVEACSVYRKKVWEECNGYDPNMGIMGYEDWDLWIGAMERGWKFHLIKEVMFEYRVHKDAMSSACNIPENRRPLIKFICNKHKNTYIANLSYVISEKDVAILQIEHHARDIIEEHRDVIRGKDVHIRDLEGMIEEHRDVIREKDVHIRDLEGMIEEHRDVIREKDVTLDNIYNSRGWKALLICYKIRDWLVPLNSRRRRFVKNLFDGIKLQTEIFKSLFLKIKKFLSELLGFSKLNHRKVRYSIDHLDLVGTKIKIRGWVFSEILKIKLLKLLLYSKKDRKEYPLLFPFERNDVHKHWKHKNAFKSGFYGNIDSVFRGTIKFKLYIEYNNGLNDTFYIGKVKAGKPGLKSFLALLRQVNVRNLNRLISHLLKGNLVNIINAVKRILSDSERSYDVSLKGYLANFPKYQDKLKLQINNEIDIIIPAYNGFNFLEKLFESIFKNTHVPFRLIIIDDSSTDQRVFPFLEMVKNKYPDKVLLLQNDDNIGFVRTVNRGFEYTNSHFVILNTDTEVPPHWLERLMYPIFNDPGIASTTPFTNSGTICSFPNILEDNPIFENLDVEYLDAFFQHVFASINYHEIPTGVGFCMGFNRDVANQIGMFDSETFTRGYGEENDWCMRAKKCGYKNIIVPNLFVYHKHGGSFSNDEKQSLLDKNLPLIMSRYPDYQIMVKDFIDRDPLKAIREFIVLLITANTGTSMPILIIDHNLGGGANMFRGHMISKMIEDGRKVFILLYDFHKSGFELIYSYRSYRLNASLNDFTDMEMLFDWIKIQEIFVNALVSFPQPLEMLGAIRSWKERLSTTLTFYVHDYHSICPSYTLMAHGKRYCGIPDIEGCNECLHRHDGEFRIYHENPDIRIWRKEWRSFLSQTDKIICFSRSSLQIIKKAYPGLDDGRIAVVPHEVSYIGLVKRPEKVNGKLIIGVLGSINLQKGSRIIKEIVNIIASNKLDIKIVVIGELIDIEGNSHVKITGEYNRKDLPKLIRSLGIDIFLMPSIWPETFSYTTEEIMKMKYPIAVFDIGAPPERVRKYEHGLIIEDINASAALNKIMEWREKRNQ